MKISGEALRTARNRARLTQPQLADQLGVSQKTVRNWEADGVSAGKEGLVVDVLGMHLAGVTEPAEVLASVSNVELGLEVVRRLDEAADVMRRFGDDRGEGGQDARTAEAKKTRGLKGTGSRRAR